VAAIDPATRAAVRNGLVEVHLDLAYALAGRYRRPGPTFDDVRQVAALALVQAVTRFDPAVDTVFWAFAAPTITGSIKRHFRDQWWMVHPPRRIKDLRLRIRTATDLLTQQLRHAPTITDLARYLGCPPQEISEALCSDNAMRPLSIDAPARATTSDGDGWTALLGSPDAAYAQVDTVHTLRSLLDELPERESHVLTLWLAEDLSQAEIAARLGCSQMQISRILRASIDRLRHRLDDGRPMAHRRRLPGRSRRPRAMVKSDRDDTAHQSRTSAGG
jgi:RNA polymerase sigma-B factor